MGWVVNATPRPIYPRDRPGTHCIGGWLGSRVGLDGCGKSRPHRDSISGPSSSSKLPYRLCYPGPHCLYNTRLFANANKIVYVYFSSLGSNFVSFAFKYFPGRLIYKTVNFMTFNRKNRTRSLCIKSFYTSFPVFELLAL